MSPRALSDKEKDLQRHKIFFAARELILAHGIKRISVDDIIKDAGVGKATFYGYFTSKEELLVRLVQEIYNELLSQAEQVIEHSSKAELRQNVGAFLRSLIKDREKVFFFSNHEELTQLLSLWQPSDINAFSQMEYHAFESLINLAGLDSSNVKPDVVHNYIHAMYFSLSDSCMMPGHLDETISAMTEGLLHYLFGCVL